MADDSSLSIAANIIGIVTFVFAIAAAIYARWVWLKSRIILSQTLERSYDRLELIMWGKSMLRDPIDFEPSEPLTYMCERMYKDILLLSLCAAKMARTKSLRARISTKDAEKYLGLLASLEARYSIARDWYMHEQTLAGIAYVVYSFGRCYWFGD
jgi:hypothetical protein